MSIFHPASVPAFFKIHPDPQANAENWAAVRLAAIVLPPVFSIIAVIIALTFGGAGIPAEQTPVAAVAPVAAVCDTDADCAAHDAAVAARSGVRLVIVPSDPAATPHATPLPTGGVRVECDPARALVTGPAGDECQEATPA